MGCREVVEHGVNGWLCHPGNTNSLISAIELFLSMSQEERARMGRLGRKKVLLEFDEKIIIENYLNTISRYLNPSVPTKISSKIKALS